MTIRIARRASAMKPSATGAATARARELRAEGRDVIALSVGEPDFDTPRHIRQAAIEAMENGLTRYTGVNGTPALREAAAEKFARENGLDAGAADIVVGVGAKQILFSALLASVDPGDEVIIPAPYWVSYPDMVRVAEGVPVIVDFPAETGFHPDVAAIEAAITDRTKWLILNSPNNPTGAVYTADELRAIADVLRRHPHVGVLSDEVYEHIVFDGRLFASMAGVAPDLADRIVTVNAVSKAYCMTGWRIGYATGPAEILAEVRKIQSQSTSCPCSISQAAAVAALRGEQGFLADHCRAYADRRDEIVPRLNAIGLATRPGEGAFYLMSDVSTLCGRTAPDGTVLESDIEVARYILEEANVATVAGTPFGAPGFIRLSFALGIERLNEAVERIGRACAALR